MSRLSSVCRSLWSSLTGASSNGRAAPRFRPQLESLEDRRLLHFSHLIHFATLPQYAAYGQDHSQTQQGSLSDEAIRATLPWQGPGYYVYFPSQAGGLSPWRHYDSLAELKQYEPAYGTWGWEGRVFGPYMTNPNQSRAHIHGASHARGGHTAGVAAGLASVQFWQNYGGSQSSPDSSAYSTPYSFSSPVNMYSNPYAYMSPVSFYGGFGNYLSPVNPYGYWW